jgi:hypothetical protein
MTDDGVTGIRHDNHKAGPAEEGKRRDKQMMKTRDNAMPPRPPMLRRRRLFSAANEETHIFRRRTGRHVRAAVTAVFV